MYHHASQMNHIASSSRLSVRQEKLIIKTGTQNGCCSMSFVSWGCVETIGRLFIPHLWGSNLCPTKLWKLKDTPNNSTVPFIFFHFLPRHDALHSRCKCTACACAASPCAIDSPWLWKLSKPEASEASRVDGPGPGNEESATTLRGEAPVGCTHHLCDLGRWCGQSRLQHGELLGKLDLFFGFNFGPPSHMLRFVLLCLVPFSFPAWKEMFKHPTRINLVCYRDLVRQSLKSTLEIDQC